MKLKDCLLALQKDSDFINHMSSYTENLSFSFQSIDSSDSMEMINTFVKNVQILEEYETPSSAVADCLEYMDDWFGFIIAKANCIKTRNRRETIFLSSKEQSEIEIFNNWMKSIKSQKSHTDTISQIEHESI